MAGDLRVGYGWEDTGERGDSYSDDTKLIWLYQLESTFYEGYVNVNFFERSLIHTVGNAVYCFSFYESDRIPGYQIIGFKSGESDNPSQMTDMGVAVFQTTGQEYRLIDWHVYADAALSENGIYCCEDPAVADGKGVMTEDNTFDVILVSNQKVGTIERVYHAEGEEDWVQRDTNEINTDFMSQWSWSMSKGYTSVSQYIYDKDGNLLSYDSVIPDTGQSGFPLPSRQKMP